MSFPQRFEPRDTEATKSVLEKKGVGEAWQVYTNPPATTTKIENTICSVVSWIFFNGRMTGKQRGFLRSLIEQRQAGGSLPKEAPTKMTPRALSTNPKARFPAPTR
jgi:hypothetical protein